MIIFDASVMIDFLVRAERVPSAAEAAACTDCLAAPNIIDFEVLNVLRRQVQAKQIAATRAVAAFELYKAIPIERYDNEVLLQRIWELRSNFTSYDAAYIALSEIFELPLYTRDSKLFGKPGHKADLRLVELV